ncbi:hypothetical protein [Bombilactobacillus bombi]|uniref:hypothetical protein n=1 Tax=Bombilactobacillus bombi TaxID=1303590 RepID=UPI0015E60335|nr:hypothetical protein [Bombilactobacillus bombi]MBA1434980.1 hypothetical protein [Bombilactobacillus bombi]
MKNNFKLVLLLPIILLMTACSRNFLSTDQQNYYADEMVTVIKGKTHPQAKVSYQLDSQAQFHQAVNHDGSFAINIARAPQKQRVTIKSNYHQQRLSQVVQITKSKAIMPYQAFAQKYNYLLMAQQQKPTLDLNLNNKMKNIVQMPQQTIRINVQQHQLMAMTLIYPLKVIKTKSGMSTTAKSIVTMSELVGANGRSVLKQLSKQMRAAKKNQTSLKTITSNGKQFKLGVSSSKFYLYITR